MPEKREPPTRPAGRDKGVKTKVLDVGARFVQDASPLKGFDAYVVGLHCAKEDPSMQMEAHHYCKRVNDDLLQCAIFDGNTDEANLIGIEYIISEWLFDGLPEEEKPYWHPHNFEVLSGQLVAPDLPDAVEKRLMEQLINSYGKTWHTWHTGTHLGEPGDPLPYGDPHLMWSFNRDGEADEALLQDRNRTMRLDTEKKRSDRQDLADTANPQRGVDLLKDAFPGAHEPPPGVSDTGKEARG